MWGLTLVPHGSVGKESACNAVDPCSIPGWARSAGEGIGYPLQYSWASFVAQLVKNPPAMRETWVRSLGWEDPLEGKGYHPLRYSGLEDSGDCRARWATLTFTFTLAKGKTVPRQARNICGWIYSQVLWV